MRNIRKNLENWERPSLESWLLVISFVLLVIAGIVQN